ncbi:MAG: acyl-CoA thioesterase [Flavobacteriaceae bacterium]|nr:acyl-CoA thioesterase [Bacteroidia bacterium]NNL15748.1 acyl-CoA thioesterase [Flavobacteriaceae bacterium]
MKSDEIEIRVRYGETDQMGYVYHGNYAQYLEMGRIEWLRKLGISYKKMEEEGIMLPVLSLSINFKKSAYYDDVINVKTQLHKLPSARIEFEYELTNEQGEIITSASTVLAFVNMHTKRPMRCPNYILDKLQI